VIDREGDIRRGRYKGWMGVIGEGWMGLIGEGVIVGVQ
jgi:hypothetical protein